MVCCCAGRRDALLLSRGQDAASGGDHDRQDIQRDGRCSRGRGSQAREGGDRGQGRTRVLHHQDPSAHALRGHLPHAGQSHLISLLNKVSGYLA